MGPYTISASAFNPVPFHQAPVFLYEALKDRHDVVLVEFQGVSTNTSDGFWGETFSHSWSPEPRSCSLPPQRAWATFPSTPTRKPATTSGSCGSRPPVASCRLRYGPASPNLHFPLTSPTPPKLDELQRDGAVVVTYAADNVLRRMTESFIFPNETAVDGHFQAQGYHATLAPTHHYDTSAAFLETLFRAPVFKVPFVWHPRIYDHYSLHTPRRFFSVRKGSRNVGIFEPNFYIDRQFTVPATALELLYRREPRAFDRVFVTNSNHFKHGEFRLVSQGLGTIR